MLLSRVHVQWGMRGSRSAGDAEIDLGWLDGPHARDISSDGETLLFVEMGTGGGRLYSTCLRRMDGSPPVRIGEGHAQDLSPDGKHVLSIRFGPPHRLVILSTGAGDSTSLPRGSIARYPGARWLPDGNGVVFTGSEAAGPWRSYVQDVDGGLPRSITPEGVAATAISPDGRFVAGAMGRRLMIFPVVGGVPKPVGEVSRGESILEWSPDARSIYLEQPGPTLSVTRFDLETGQRTVWKIFTVPDPAGIWVRGPVFAGNGQAYAYNYMRWLDELYVVEGLK